MQIKDIAEYIMKTAQERQTINIKQNVKFYGRMHPEKLDQIQNGRLLFTLLCLIRVWP